MPASAWRFWSADCSILALRDEKAFPDRGSGDSAEGRETRRIDHDHAALHF